MTRLHRKNATLRKLTLGSLDHLDVMAMLHGPDPRGGISADEIKEFYAENREVFVVLREPKAKVKPGDTLGHFPGKRSWCWWQVDAPEPRDEELPETEQLDRLSLLSDEELHLLESNVRWPPKNEMSAHLFSRPWIWWKSVSPDLRDWDISEAAQLVSMGRKYLTERECEFLDTGADPSNHSRLEPTDFFTHQEITHFRIPVPAGA